MLFNTFINNTQNQIFQTDQMFLYHSNLNCFKNVALKMLSLSDGRNKNIFQVAAPQIAPLVLIYKKNLYKIHLGFLSKYIFSTVIHSIVYSINDNKT